MKRNILIVLLLGALCSASFAVIISTIEAPQDDATARRDVRDRRELNTIQTAYENIIQTHFWPLKLNGVSNFFGPKLNKEPDDMVLPLFAGNEIYLHALVKTTTPVKKCPPDFYNVGDIGYIKWFYDCNSGSDIRLETFVFYLRSDDKFVPLKSTNDFSKRLEWEKVKFAALNKWLDEHMPSTDLGEVEVSVSNSNRVELGGDRACIITTQLVPSHVLGQPTVTNFCYIRIYLADEGANLDERLQSVQNRKNLIKGSMLSWPVLQTNQPIVFVVGDKLYRLTPKLVEQLHGTHN